MRLRGKKLSNLRTPRPESAGFLPRKSFPTGLSIPKACGLTAAENVPHEHYRIQSGREYRGLRQGDRGSIEPLGRGAFWAAGWHHRRILPDLRRRAGLHVRPLGRALQKLARGTSMSCRKTRHSILQLDNRPKPVFPRSGHGWAHHSKRLRTRTLTSDLPPLPRLTRAKALGGTATDITLRFSHGARRGSVGT